MVGTEKLDLGKLAERFEVHNRSEEKSPRTVQWYNQTLDIFAAWLAEEGMSNCLDDIGEDEVRLFILHLKARPGLRGPASSHTVKNRVRPFGPSSTGFTRMTTPSATAWRR